MRRMRLTTKICVKFKHAEISLASSFCVNFLSNRLDEDIIFTTQSRQLIACGTNDNFMNNATSQPFQFGILFHSRISQFWQSNKSKADIDRHRRNTIFDD